MTSVQKSATRERSGWSPQRRAAQAAAIRRWRPWERSTGPRTASGKAVSARNATTHGYHGRALAPLVAALARQRRLLAFVRQIHRLCRKYPRNELLAALWRQAEIESARSLVALARALTRAISCKNPDPWAHLWAS